MTEIVLATRNIGKLKEFERLLGGLDVTLHTLNEFPDVSDIEESGSTFEENALIKATEVSRTTGMVVIADDSGLAVEALGGRPGVMSARYSGEDADDSKNNTKLILDMQAVPEGERKATFVCVIALATPDGRNMTVNGRCEGEIGFAPKGEGGFGYDPLFYLPDYGCTMAELSPDEKDAVSHRGMAVRELRKVLPEFLASCGESFRCKL